MFAKVIVDIAHANVDKLFTYRIPPEIDVQAGMRVLVSFGAGNKKIEGFVLELTDSFEVDAHIKPILKTMEPYPVLTDEQIRLAYWIKQSYNCLLVDALRLMIPSQLRGGRIKEKTVRTVRIAAGLDVEAARSSMLKKDGLPRSPRQSEVFELLLQYGGEMSAEDITAFIPNSASAIRALIEKNYIEERGHESYRDPFKHIKIPQSAPPILTDEQSAAYERISAAMDAEGGTFLLHGVTGSGKTEVYMRAIAKAVELGGTAIVLVPEIALTPQAMQRFRSRFGERVAVLHSRLSPGERYDEWRRIRLHKADVVLGARSAVFAPLENIRLIVMDEEHEQSYSSEITPRYNAAEVAQTRCRMNGAALILGSATPSVISYNRAVRGRYTLIEMKERVNALPLPKVEIADMRAEFAAGNNGIFSAKLHDVLKRCIESGEQAILLMNRRGYSTFVSCRGCGYVFKCDNCDVSMTFHKLENVMKCHYCGAVKHIPKTCPECGKQYIKFFGVGTQQVEEQLNLLFPEVSVLRMDADTTRTKNAHYELLARFAEGEAQVLVGTQMIAKGLDIPNVSLVGVVAADATLHIPDYRSCERTFQLLTQVAGRAGRAHNNGLVVIQSYTPEHPAIQLASRHDYKGFYEYEIAERRAALFPPFSLFVRVLFSHADEPALMETAELFAEGLKKAVEEALSIQHADPRELIFMLCSPAPITRKLGQYRYHVVMKLARTKHTPEVVAAIYRFTNDHRSEYFTALELNPADMF